MSAVVNNTEGNGDGIFLQAVSLCYYCFRTSIYALQISTSNRYGDSRQAYREVQERHQDIQRIEHTLGEIAQLFNDVRHFFNMSSTRNLTTCILDGESY